MSTNIEKQQRLFNSIDRDEFKSTNHISRRYNTEWKRFAGRYSIGDCSNLFQRLQPTGYHDFYLKYTADGEATEDERDKYPFCGRSEREITVIAEKYRDACGDYSIPLEDYIKNVYMHTIIETFDGQTKEKCIADALIKMGYTYNKPKGDEDSLLGIDFKVGRGGKLLFALQVKPLSFFVGRRNLSLINDRKNAFSKGEATLNRLGVPTYFIVYDIGKDGKVKWLTNNGKMCFKLDQLCNHNGIPLKIPETFCEL